MTTPLNENCQYDGCNQPARYALFRTYPDGKKVWLHVCKGHERLIGDENLRQDGGRARRRKEVMLRE